MKQFNNDFMDTETLIEAILFYKASPAKMSDIGKMLGKKADEIEDALTKLDGKLEGRGIRLLWTGETVALATSPEASGFINELRKEELSGDLGKAALLTLSLVLYRAPISKNEIDYIRGVNSSSSLRTLLVRGLLERKRNEKGTRGFVYTPTIDTLAYLGVSRAEDLPQHKEVREEVLRFRREFSSEGESAPGGQGDTEEKDAKQITSEYEEETE